MKRRNGFISNSSTTSFIIVGIQPTEKQLKELTKDEFEKFKKNYLEGSNPADEISDEEFFLKGSTVKPKQIHR